MIYPIFSEKRNIRPCGKRYTGFFGQQPEIKAPEKMDCHRSLGIPENERTEEASGGFRIDHIRDKSCIAFSLTRQEVAGVVQYDRPAIDGSDASEIQAFVKSGYCDFPGSEAVRPYAKDGEPMSIFINDTCASVKKISVRPKVIPSPRSIALNLGSVFSNGLLSNDHVTGRCWMWFHQF